MRPPHRLGVLLLALGLSTLPQSSQSAAGPRAELAGAHSPPGAARAVPRCDGRPATIVGTKRADRIEGTSGPDVIVGRKGADRIDGRGGADVICGNAGSDVLLGGGGDDRLLGGADQHAVGTAGTYLVGDVLVGGPGRDRLDGGADTRAADQRRRPDTYSWADANRRVRVDLGGTDGTGTARGRGRDVVVVGPSSGIVGSAYGDRITGSRGHDRVQGGDGGDRIDTGPGNDQVFTDRGRNRPGRDHVTTGKGDDLVSSLAGRDEIVTGGGDDFVEAFSHAPTLVALGAGDDYVGHYVAPGAGAAADGGPGNDVVAFYGRLLERERSRPRFTVDYRNGTTRSTGDVATGRISGFEGHRFVGELEWSFFGGRGDDRVWAIEGGPLLARGYAGDDSFTGSSRGDLLVGGDGRDYASGRGGRDVCRSIERGDC